MISPIFSSLRPKQWGKNLLIFLPLIFCGSSLLTYWPAWAYTLIGFITLCGLSGSTYVLNDLIDISKDRIHPIKCQRPIASGVLSLKEAKVALLLLLFASLFVAWEISQSFFAIALGFFMLNLAYSFKLKKILLLDVFTLALCSVLRALSGVGILVALDSNIFLSNWLILAIFMLSAFGILMKRRQELEVNDDSKIIALQKDSPLYTVESIEQLAPIFISIGVIAYSIFVLSTSMANHLIYTIPLIFYYYLRRLIR